MKNVLNFRSLILAVGLFSSLTGAAVAGTHTGGGGDDVEQSFVAAASSGIDALYKISGQLPRIDMSKVDAEWDQASVQATDEELRDAKGIIKVALNFPDQHLIKVNRERWREVTLNKKKAALGLHEVLGLARYETGNYRISAAVFGMDPHMEETGSSYLALIVSGMSFHPFAENGKIQNWFQVSKDQDQKLQFTYPNGETRTFQCDSDYAGEGDHPFPSSPSVSWTPRKPDTFHRCYDVNGHGPESTSVGLEEKLDAAVPGRPEGNGSEVEIEPDGSLLLTDFNDSWHCEDGFGPFCGVGRVTRDKAPTHKWIPINSLPHEGPTPDSQR